MKSIQVLAASIIYLAGAFFTVAMAQVEKAPPVELRKDPMLSVTHDRSGKLQVGLFNLSEQDFLLGEMQSALGCDQFKIVIETGSKTFELKRKPQAFTIDLRRTIRIQPGSFHCYSLDLFDGTWGTADQTNWNSTIPVSSKIKVLYDSEACAHKELRQQKKFLRNYVESKWYVAKEAIRPTPSKPAFMKN